jgi:hypothetical protein
MISIFLQKVGWAVKEKFILRIYILPGQVSKKIPPGSQQHPDKNGNMAEI